MSDKRRMMSDKRCIIIADAGSTKVEWALVTADGGVTRCVTAGVNALTATDNDISDIFADVKQQLCASVRKKPLSADFKPLTASDGKEQLNLCSPAEIYYYGAGCATTYICDKIKRLLSAVWTGSGIFVTTDLLGAARALLDDKPGIACILGTGSNSCLYDGEKIVSNTPSLGFILGDEGGGAALGKQLLADAFKGLLSADLTEELLDTYSITKGNLLDNVYRGTAPSRFLASTVPFIKQHIDRKEMRDLVRNQFVSFFRRNLDSYRIERSLPTAFTGSISLIFEDILREAAHIAGYRIDRIQAKPMDGLISFHKHSLNNNNSAENP